MLNCYETFGVIITKHDMHEKCTDIHKENMYEEIAEYHICLNELGCQVTADDIILDHNDMIISVDERKFILYPNTTLYPEISYDYETNMELMRWSVSESAYFCKQKYES